jgi:ribosomal protein S18 acetylase RimI-like enzyme
MVSIRLWSERDIDYVSESIQREGWGHSRRDVERCWRWEPEGCFVAEADGKRAGHVFSIRYDRMGWIGLLIVDARERGRGIGRMLMENAISHLEESGADTIRLEAVERAVPLYRRLGFKEEFDSLRYKKRTGLRTKNAKMQAGIRPMEKTDIETVAGFDSRYFGVSRLRVLTSLYEDIPPLCFISESEGNPSGYIMARKTREAHWIGPWVSADSQNAEGLFHACLKALEGQTELRLGMPAPNKHGVFLMERLGFRLTGKSVRMVLSPRSPAVATGATGVYGIGGPEKG